MSCLALSRHVGRIYFSFPLVLSLSLPLSLSPIFFPFFFFSPFPSPSPSRSFIRPRHWCSGQGAEPPVTAARADDDEDRWG